MESQRMDIGSPGEEKAYPIQYSGLENSMECIGYGVANSWTRLSDFHFGDLKEKHFYLFLKCILFKYS